MPTEPPIKEGRLLRVGVLGCGPIAQAAHFEACRRARNAELYAICDVAEYLRRRMQAVHQPAMAFADYDAMLADPGVEAIVVAVADSFHVAAAKKALAAGKHVLVEKPLGVTVEECEELERAAAASGLVVQVGNMKRFDPGIAFARAFLESEGGGKLALKAWYCDSIYRYVETGNLQPLPLTSPQARRPPGDPKANRGAYYLLTHGSHLLDTARFLGGEMTSVDARLSEKFGAFCWMIGVEFAAGFFGQLELTIPIRAGWHEGFSVHAEHGSVFGRTFNPWHLRSSEVECFSARDGQSHRVYGEDGHVYRLQVEAFADAILRGTPPQGASASDGTAVLRALVAIDQSTRRRHPVRLAEAGGGLK